jgi:hypothetical protein
VGLLEAVSVLFVSGGQVKGGVAECGGREGFGGPVRVARPACPQAERVEVRDPACRPRRFDV